MSAFQSFQSQIETQAPRTAVVFGSGLSGAIEGHFVPVASIPYANVPGLVPPTVAGHGGQLALGHWNGVAVLLGLGRVHYYEGHPWERVTQLIRQFAGFGIQTVLLTNAAGGIRDDLNPGDLMPIRGFQKLLQPDAWRTLGKQGDTISQQINPISQNEIPLLERATGKPAGIYAALTGPCYETPAEIRALRTVGVDAVGMSTAMEAELAQELGMSVLGLSCITNKAAGLSAGTLNHHEVEIVARQAVGRLGTVISEVFSRR